MANEWIKMRIDLSSDPAVFHMACEMEQTEHAVVGMLHAFWSWANKHTEDGNVYGVTDVTIDRIIGVTGFAQALAKGDGKTPWLILHEDRIEIPNFERHNGKSAKNRAFTAERVARHREKKRNASVTPKALPEKRREEKNKTIVPEKENSTSSVPSDEQNYSFSETGKDLDLKTDTPVNRWIKKFQAYRPTAGHPLATLSPHDIADVRQRVAELIEWQTEPKAIELLQKAFEKPPRPSTVKQAVFACTKIVEASPPSSTGQHADTTPDVSQSIYKEWTGHAR